MARRQHVIHLPRYPGLPDSDGYRVTVTRKGIELFAYQGCVGIQPMHLTWEQLLAAKAEVDAVIRRGMSP